MGLGEIRLRLRTAQRRARALDLRAYEEAAPALLRERVLPQLNELLERAGAEHGALLQTAEAAGAAEVADVAFLARLELRSQRERLASLPAESEGWLLLGECGAAQRAVLRAGAAAEAALRAALGQRPLRRGRELGRSLRLRAAYARLRRSLCGLGEPEPGELAPALRRAAAQLEAFAQSEDFAEARVEDRLTLRSLLLRARAWLAAPAEPREGLRLWQDLTSAAALLSQINLRAELVEHDRAVVRAAARRLGGPRLPASVPAPLWAKLQRLYGRDDTVDGLLESGAGLLAVEWLEPLERLQQTLGLAAKPAPAEPTELGEDDFLSL